MQRIELFARAVEPTLQQELKHKGAANGDGSYSAELIGYVEIFVDLSPRCVIAIRCGTKIQIFHQTHPAVPRPKSQEDLR